MYDKKQSVSLGGLGGVGKVAKTGIEGNRERIQIKTIVHREWKDA